MRLSCLEGRTAILSNTTSCPVRDADRIIYIHEGMKIEEGTHEELLS